MKTLFILLLLFAVPVVVAQTVVETHETVTRNATQVVDSRQGIEVAPIVVESAPCECVNHGASIMESCDEVAKCDCGSCCHVGGCDDSPCGPECNGICCNDVVYDEFGNIVSIRRTRNRESVAPDGASVAVGDSYASGSSVRGFGGGGAGGSGISAFSGGWGIGYAGVGGGGGGGGRRAVAFAGFGARGFRNRTTVSASE